jgi:hypothetical protein
MFKEEDEELNYFYCLTRSFVSMSMLFIILAFLFDMFKWATFLASASLETSYLSSIDGEKLLVRRNKQLKIILSITLAIVIGVSLYFFVQSLILIRNYELFL